MAELLAHQRRVVDEHAELKKRVAKLYAFVGSAGYNEVSGAERRHLVEQGFHMTGYMLALEARLSCWGVKP